MAKWFFEPGHTAAEFSVRHMMVTFVRGHFKNAHGTLVFDPANPRDASVEVTIDSAGIWTGEADRDALQLGLQLLPKRGPTLSCQGLDGLVLVQTRVSRRAARPACTARSESPAPASH